MRGLVVFAATAALSTASWGAGVHDRLAESARVFSEIMRAPDKGIPHDLLSKAACVVIIPGLKKAAFVVGGEYGRGFAECRNANGTGWGAPAAMRLEGGSFGFQIGGSSTDIVLLVLNRHGMDKLAGDKFTLGADASVAAGPVGRTANAETDVKMSAEILAWSRAKGLFAGISLNGATLRPDQEENEVLHGHKMNTREVLMGDMQPPAAANQLISELDRYAGHHENNAERSRQ
jgi:lipid-binding SYLF domain-containing protein